MGAPHVTPREIERMQQLYAELGTYSDVGKIMHRSASTVSKYVQMKEVVRNVRQTVKLLAIKESR